MVRRRLIRMPRENPALIKHRNQCQTFDVGFLYKDITFADGLRCVDNKRKFLVVVFVISLVVACVNCNNKKGFIRSGEIPTIGKSANAKYPKSAKKTSNFANVCSMLRVRL